jgi:hypothetical protein
MRNRFPVFLSSLAVVLFCFIASATAQAQVIVFGPETYTRTTGSPQTITKTFSVQDANQEFALFVQNGDQSNGKTSSAVIDVNGLRIVGPSEFNQQVSFIARPVSLLQQNTISVELRGEPGSTITVTIRTGGVPPFVPQFTFFSNPTDPLLFRQETPNGEVIDYFGDRDANGLPTGLYSYRVTSADGSTVTSMLDTLGRPVLVEVEPENVIFQIEWQSETLMKISVFTDGDFQFTAPVNLAPATANNLLKGFPTLTLASWTSSSLQPIKSAAAAQSLPLPPNSTVVKVNACGTPNNNALVTIDAPGLGGSIPARRFGNGLYFAQLPGYVPNIGPPINKFCSSLQKVLRRVCGTDDQLIATGVGRREILNSLEPAAASSAQSQAILSATKKLSGAITFLCVTVEPCKKLGNYLDRTISAPVTIRPIVNLQGIIKCASPAALVPRQQIPNFTVDFPCSCKSGFGARLFSTQRDIQIVVIPPQADFTDEIRLARPVSRFIATNRYTGPPIDIFSYRVGEELVFSIFVRETGQTFYSGPGSNNPDGLVHARVDCLGNGRARISFEDTFGGGDRDYDDAVFEIVSGRFQGPICR